MCKCQDEVVPAPNNIFIGPSMDYKFQIPNVRLQKIYYSMINNLDLLGIKILTCEENFSPF